MISDTDPARIRFEFSAAELGLTRAIGEAALGDEWLTALLAAPRTQAGRPRGDAWERYRAHRDRIKQLLTCESAGRGNLDEPDG